MKIKITQLMFAVSAASLLASAPTLAFVGSSSNHGTGTSINCYGLNSCKGQSSCKTAANACKGMNACKQKGFVMVATPNDCTSAGGTLSDPLNQYINEKK